MREGEPKSDEIQEPERLSGLVRVVGGTPEEEKDALKKVADNYFNKQEFYDAEREKTPEEMEIIKGILTRLPEFVKKYGGKPVPLTPDHIHVLDFNRMSEEEKKNLGNIIGHYDHILQTARVIVEGNEDNNLNFANRTVHELLHFSSFQSADFENKENKILNEQHRIGGLLIRTSDELGKEQIYFNDWDEAITEELAVRFDEEYFKSIEPLSEILKQRDKLRANFAENHPETSQGDVKRIVNNITSNGDFTYFVERQECTMIIENIFKNNSDKFRSIDEVFDVFAKAYFTGKILPIAKLVEKTYGNGSFREFGEKTKDKKHNEIGNKN